MKLKIRSLSTVVLATACCSALHKYNQLMQTIQHERACSNKTLKGSYGFYRSGITSTGPLVGGIFSFDGNGTVSGSQSISRNGVFTFDAPILGPYEVAADCTARFLTDTG